MHGFVASNPRGKSFNFASKRGMIFGAIGPRSGHDRATITPRSGPNLRRGRLSVVVRSSGGDSAAEGARSRFDRAAIAVRSRRDRGSIAPRSRFDRAAIKSFFHLSSLPSDEGLIVMKIPTVRWRSDIFDASTRCFGSRKIPTVHAASNACKQKSMTWPHIYFQQIKSRHVNVETALHLIHAVSFNVVSEVRFT